MSSQPTTLAALFKPDQDQVLQRIHTALDTIHQYVQDVETTTPDRVTWIRICDLFKLADDLEEITEYVG